MRVLRFATVAALALTLSATTGDAKKNKQKQCHDDANVDSATPAMITLTPSASTPTTTPTAVPVTTPPPATATPIATPHSTETAAPDATTSPNTSKAPGLKLKLFKKADLDGKKVVVKTVNDVCYTVDACFDDATKSLEWTKVPSDVTRIELFEAARCTGASVAITDLGVVGGGGNVTTLKDLNFMKKLSAFVVRSTTGGNAIATYDDGCAATAVTDSA